MRKYLCLLLALLLCLSALPALALDGAQGLGYGFNPTGERIVDEEITIHVLYQRDNRHGDFDKMWFIDYVAEKTGIRLEFEQVEKAAWQERVSVAFGTDDYPDVFMNGVTSNMISKYSGEGYLIDLMPYIKQYAPFTISEYNRYPELVKEVVTEKGQIFYMPSINASPRALIKQYPMWINMQWIKNLGLEVPTTLDELYTVLMAFKTQDANLNGDPNDEIPVLTSALSSNNASPAEADKFSMQVLTALGVVDGRDAVMDGKYVFVPTLENYREYLKYMNKIYTEGLLDNEYFTMTSEAMSAKEAAGRAGMMITSPYYSLPNPEDYEEYGTLPPLTSDINSELMWPAQSACKLEWGTCVVTDKCKYPEAVVRLIDWFYTVEGSRAVRAGCEYGTWTDDAGVQYGYEIVTPAEETANGHLIAKLHLGEYSSYWACRLGEIGPCNLPFNSTDAVNDIVIAGDVMNLWCYDQIMASGAVEARKFALPVLSYTDEESTKLSTFLDLTNYVDTMEAKFIRGDLDIDKTWDDFQAQLQKLKVDDMCAIYQGAYDRYLARPDQITVD